MTQALPERDQAFPSPPAPPLVRLESAEVRFPLPGRRRASRRALAAVDIEVRDGELLVIVGKSGCGKTTVLNLLAGLVSLHSGSVSINGKSPSDARHELSYMFARDALLPWRTARRNVELAIEAREPKVRRAQRRERAQQFLELLEVGRSGNLYPWQLSQGMRQRVALARTWAVAPKLLLMDEPFAALDAQTRADAQQQFLDIWIRERRTVIFVTHDLTEALLLADRVVVMEAGRVIGDVTVDLPRPRHLEELEESAEFRRLHRLLTSLIHKKEALA